MPAEKWISIAVPAIVERDLFSAVGEQLDEAVWSDVRSLLEEPGRIRREFERRLQAAVAGESSPPRQRAEALAAGLRRGIARLIDAYRDGLLEKEEFAPRLADARGRLAKVEAEIQSLAAVQAAAQEMQRVMENLEAFAGQVKSGLAEADWARKRELIRLLVKRIEIEKEQVRLVYKVDLRPFEKGPERGIWEDCALRVGVARNAKIKILFPRFPVEFLKKRCALLRARIPQPRNTAPLYGRCYVPDAGSPSRRVGLAPVSGSRSPSSTRPAHGPLPGARALLNSSDPTSCPPCLRVSVVHRVYRILAGHSVRCAFGPHPRNEQTQTKPFPKSPTACPTTTSRVARSAFAPNKPTPAQRPSSNVQQLSCYKPALTNTKDQS